jgi:hypothetical protein
MPKVGEGTLCAAASAHRPTIGHHRTIHGARTAGAYTIKSNSRVVEQSVEDTPRESTVSAATLQSQIDDLLLYR